MRLDIAQGTVENFAAIALEAGLSTDNLQKVTEIMTRPFITALRLFVALGAEQSETAQWMALHKYEHPGSPHNSFNNDRFYIAHRFGLDDDKKRASARALIINGMAGYYEPKTHGGFRLSDYLCELGIIEKPDYNLGPKEGLYAFLGKNRIRKIAEKFGFTDDELADCAEEVCEWSFKKIYPETRDILDDMGPNFSLNGNTILLIRQLSSLAQTFLSGERLDAMRTRISDADESHEYHTFTARNKRIL
ncbi:MAG: hypothetical protein KAT43_06530 [Nanoarchaeota archaeon]|nr:hypothetical protein [Nanoarchaeota archaeon]